MSEITVFLLALIGILGSANTLLWFTDRNKNSKASNETAFLKTSKAKVLQNNEIQAIQEQLMQLSEYQNELKEIKAFKKAEPLYPKKEKSPKNNRLKILEDYLKKV